MLMFDLIIFLVSDLRIYDILQIMVIKWDKTDWTRNYNNVSEVQVRNYVK